jgi:hypothetical protein
LLYTIITHYIKTKIFNGAHTKFESSLESLL